MSLAAGVCIQALAQGSDAPAKLRGSDSALVRPGDLVPPRVAAPCKPGRCPFEGQHVTVLAVDSQPIGAPLVELKAEFEAATGATLEIVRRPNGELFTTLM